MVYFRASDPRYLASSALYVITTLIGLFHHDGPEFLDLAFVHHALTTIGQFYVYRLFIVWGRNWRVIMLPSALMVGLAGW